jgi:hypothetical protein
MFPDAYILQGNLYRDTGESSLVLSSFKKAIKSASSDLEKEAVAEKIIRELNDDIVRLNELNSELSAIKNALPEVTLLLHSRYFNKEWYLTTYQDVANAGVDPVKHYLEYGWKERRDPSPLFSTAYYLDTYPDIKIAEVNPLLHYLRAGINEGRKIKVP